MENLPDWAARLPAVNAALNSIATVLLVAGYMLMRRGKIRGHRNVMLSCFAVSVVFLGFYLCYHWALHEYTDLPGKPFPGGGWARWLYYTILVTHVPLAALVPVGAVAAIYFAFKGRIATHTRITRKLYPVWLYVSVTGVVIYGMLYHWPDASP